ncbi:hypothetical protein SAMN05421770_1011142 [Granulicella rosea]|uniref:Alpha-L-arabinofuranosidase n=1 Tax=Granulicella rosea TaxID=474952 RepID=A0A239ESU5_9BACT|nr:hypothetical protein [Granulicella rosea]SNS47725.1 hypothetical protein SAMN05421770_1011142 [Granulicella rosea]
MLRAALITATSLLTATGCQTASPQTQTRTTDIAIGAPLRTHVKRLGINLSGQSYYDSGQMLRNLVFRNPGFEGQSWQSILHCKTVTPTTCTDANPWTVWPANFVRGATFQVLPNGATATITGSTAVTPGAGVTLSFAPMTKPPAAGDFIVLHIDQPGTAEAGWWHGVTGGAALSTEFRDLAPHTLGRQALRMEASAPGQTASVQSYFDSRAGLSFVHLHGSYRIRFRAKGLGGSRQLEVSLQRLDTVNGLANFFSRTIPLGAAWQDYSFDFPTAEKPGAVGPVVLTFKVAGASALLDDVSLTPATQSSGNPTAFRDEVVQTLRDLHPGVLRYMDNGTNFGSTLDNMLAPPFARLRAGSSTQTSLQEDIPIGLHEFLALARAVGAEPWYSMPAGTSPAEARNLIEYLAGDAHTPYGTRRAALGQVAPWTSVFGAIHLELGNELWNDRSFAGAAIQDPAVHGQRAAALFAAARSHPAFQPAKFDLILGAWAANSWWTGQQLEHSSGYDSTAVAPYLFSNFNDTRNPEAIFGPMFAQPEMLDSRPGGGMAQQAEAARKAKRPANLAVYEVNLGTSAGSASQPAIDATVPSLGAGLAVVDHMLLMLRDLGVTTQALFALPEYDNGFTGSAGAKETTPLWGAVVDMGGATNRRRPSFLAEQLANSAILPTMLATSATGANPTWDQPKSANDDIELRGAHLIQSFAFADGPRRSLILLNLSRTESLSVTLSGQNAPVGPVEQRRLTSRHITDNNERGADVAIDPHISLKINGSTTYVLPPYSMTTLSWRTQ